MGLYLIIKGITMKHDQYFEAIYPGVKIVYSYDCQIAWLQFEFDGNIVSYKYNPDDTR
jgi:hypothetical protein